MYYLFLAEGFEETEAIAPLDFMRRAKLSVKTVGVTGEYVTSSHGVTVKPDISIEEITTEGLEGVILPGGMPGTINLEADSRVTECVRYCSESSLLVAAICAAPSILGHMGLLGGKRATCFPGFESALKGAEATGAPVETDGCVITARGAGCAAEFGRAIVAHAIGASEAGRIAGEMQCP